MPWMALAGASIVGGLIQGSAAEKAAQTQANSANLASNLQYQMFLQQQANMQPWMKAGQGSLSQMAVLTGPGGQMSQMPTSQDIMSQFAPNYQFQLQQGLGQAANAANATGGMVSGNELQGLNTFAQNFAGNAYQNAFNNYQTAQGNIFNRLASIAGLGQASTGNVMNAGMGTAANMGNLLTSGAAAQAAGTIGQANAFNQGLGNLASMYMLNKLGTFNTPAASAGGGLGALAGLGG